MGPGFLLLLLLFFRSNHALAPAAPPPPLFSCWITDALPPAARPSSPSDRPLVHPHPLPQLLFLSFGDSILTRLPSTFPSASSQFHATITCEEAMELENSTRENRSPDRLSSPSVSVDESQFLPEPQAEAQSEVSAKSRLLLPQAEELLESPDTSPALCSLSLSVERELVAEDVDRIRVSTEEVNDKDEIVQQHMRIAEEAIAGWEKAETVAAELKGKLETAEELKLAAEDRASHLDGALKECMKQLRHVREEQEQKIHDAVMKTTTDWERIRTDMESRLHSATIELCDALAENQTMSKSLSEMKGTKSRLQADNVKLQTRLTSAEKENAALKNEIQAMRKELELRNQEREATKRSGELANKQNLENNKKIAKLEEECQRLKLLLRKRSPNTGSLKIPPEMPPVDKVRRTSPCRKSWTTSLPPQFVDVDSVEDYLEDGTIEDNRIRAETSLLNDKILFMEEELISFKKSLARKDDELQSAREMCAKAVNKLSLLESRLETQSCSYYSSKSPSGGSISSAEESKGGNAWATALIEQLAQIRKSPISDGSQTCSLSLDIMDDFAEMEKLASSSFPHANEDDRRSSSSVLDCDEKQVDTGHGLADGVQTSDSNKIREEITEKHNQTGLQLIDVEEKQSVHDARINQLDESHVMKHGVEENSNLEVVEATKIAIDHEKDARMKLDSDVSSANNAYESFTGNVKLNAWSSKSASHAKELSTAADLDFHNAGAELVAAVRKVVHIVESIGQTDYNFSYSEQIFGSDLENNEENPSESPGKDWRRSGINACVESLITLCKSLVHGKVDIIDFIAEVASALDWLVGLIFAVAEQSSTRDCTQVQSDKGKVLIDCSDSELTSAGSSPIINDIAGKKVKNIDAQDIPIDHSSLSDMSFQFSDSSVQDSDISKLSSEHSALILNLEAVTKKANKYESEILRLKLVNEKLGHTHEATMEKLTELDSELHEAKQKVQDLTMELMESKGHSAKLQFELQDVLDQKHFIENTVKDMEYAKIALESEICDANKNMKSLQRKVASLDEELNEEIKCRKEAERQHLELKEKQEFHESESGSSMDDVETKLKKEKAIGEAAERLAECQQTILNLSDQLKALGVSKNILFLPLYNPFPTPSSSSKSTTEVNAQDPSKHSDPWREGSLSRNVGRNQEEQVAVESSKSGSYGGKEEKYDNERFSKEMQPLEYYENTGSNNKFPSSWNGEVQDVCSSNSETPTSSSPRSSARFLSLRTKNSSFHEQPKQADNENGEKNALSRFFGRTRSSH